MDDLVARDSALIAKAEKIRFFPFAVAGGQGAWLRDEGGRRVLDFTSGWAVQNVGYGNRRIRQAITDCLDAGYYAGITSSVVRSALDLAERLLDLAPLNAENPKVWFGHSGSDANECVVRLATLATGRKRILSFVGSYHGSTDGSAAISGHTAQARFAGSPASVKLPYPDAYHPQFDSDPAADEQSILRYVDNYVLDSISPRDDTAALVVEAIQSDGGDLFPSPQFLRGLEEICRRNSILLVLDEVKVGMGRTGDWFAYQHAGIHPDVVVLGKALGGGLPLSAVLAPAELLDVGTALALFTTAGNAASTSAGLAQIQEIEDEQLRGNARSVGALLKSRLQEVACRHPLVGDVRGRGLMIGVELVADHATRSPAAKKTAEVVWRSYELGLVVFYVGLRSNVLEITPPLSLSSEEAELGASILERAIAEIEDGWSPPADFSNYAGW